MESHLSDPAIKWFNFEDKMADPPQHASTCSQIFGSNLEQISEMAF
jgi:hypothetical protein